MSICSSFTKNIITAIYHWCTYLSSNLYIILSLWLNSKEGGSIKQLPKVAKDLSHTSLPDLTGANSIFFCHLLRLHCSNPLPLFITSIEGGIWKIERGRGNGNMVLGQVFLKWGGWHFFYLIFSRFIIFTFRNYFTLCKIVLYFEEHFFFANIILWKKVILSCLKMNLCVCVRKVGVSN